LIDEDHARPRQHAFNQPAAFKVTASAVVYEVTNAQAYLA
jgi:hypothetical protein